jgi:hypothetical protein
MCTFTGVGMSTVAVSPTCSLPAVAAPRLITTSSGEAGALPAASR